MNQREYERLKRKIQAEAEEKLRALDIVWSLLNDGAEKRQEPLLSGPHAVTASQVLPQTAPGGSGTNGGRPQKRMRVTQEVKQAILEAGTTFDQQDISEIIETKYPGVEVHRGSVSNAISRLLERGENVDGYRLELEERGFGSVPNVYRKVRVSSSEDAPLADEEEDAPPNENGAEVHDDMEDIPW